MPDEYQRTLIDALQEQNIFRQLAHVITTTSGERKIPVVASHGTAAWIDEEGSYPESDDAFGQVSIGSYKLATIFSNKIDDNGVLIRTANDKPGYFAVGFMSEKANGTYRYVWLFKVRAKPVTETYATKEGTSITRQTGEVEWTAIKRTSDGRYQAVADEGENGFTAEKAAAFLNTVYTPVFTAVGS